MPVSPGFPTPNFPAVSPHREARHDGVSPSLPESPHQFPHPVSPPPFIRRGNGETPRGTQTGDQKHLPRQTNLTTVRQTFTREERRS